MAGSVKSVIAENRLQVTDITEIQDIAFPSLPSYAQQLFRVRGRIWTGHWISTFGHSIREAVNKWLDWNY